MPKSKTDLQPLLPAPKGLQENPLKGTLDQNAAEIWEEFFDLSEDAIFIVDAELRIISANRAAQWRFSDPQGLIGQFCHKVVRGRQAPCEDCPLTQVRAQGKRAVIDLCLGPDENQVFQITTDPIFNKHGEFVGAVNFVRDVSAQQQAREQLQQAERILKNSPMVVFHWDNAPNWPVRYVSENIHEMLGYSAQDFTQGRLLYADIIDQDDQSRVLGEVNSAMSKPNLEHFTHSPYRLRDVRGDPVWVEDRTIILRDAQGRITGFEGILLDISPRMVTLEALVNSEHFMREMVDMLSDVLWQTDAKGELSYLSNSITALLGYTPDELLGTSIFSTLPSSEQDAALSKLLATPADPKAKSSMDHWHLHQSGRRVLVSSRYAPIVDDEGAITGFRGSAREITAQHRAQSQVVQSERLSSIGMLAAGVAHEINNPLTYLIAFFDTISGELGELKQAQRALEGQIQSLSRSDQGQVLDLQKVRSQTEQLQSETQELEKLAQDAAKGAWRIRDIVRGIKNFSRADSDELEPVDIHQAIESAINMAFHEIKYRATLIREFADLESLMANEGRLAQVFLNLLINAAHAIPFGDPSSNTIRIRSEQTPSHIVVSVEDSGCGIKEDRLGVIFEPFFTTKPKGIGSGLGLAICKNIIESYGGELQVSSTLGQGSCFTIRLPRSMQKLHALPSQQDERENGSPQQAAQILIVDDDILIRESLSQVLGGQHQLTLCASAKEAMEILALSQNFDLILSDLMMPNMTGADLFNWIEANHPSLSYKVVFITGGVFSTELQAFVDDTSQLILEKPFAPDEIRKQISALLGPVA